MERERERGDGRAMKRGESREAERERGPGERVKGERHRETTKKPHNKVGGRRVRSCFTKTSNTWRQ